MLKRIKKGPVTYGTLTDRPLLPEQQELDHQTSQAVKTKSVPKLALYYTVLSGKAVLYVIDTMGEWLAEFFGITPPLEWYIEEEERRQGVRQRGGKRDQGLDVEETCLVEETCSVEDDVVSDTGKIG